MKCETALCAHTCRATPANPQKMEILSEKEQQAALPEDRENLQLFSFSFYELFPDAQLLPAP